METKRNVKIETQELLGEVAVALSDVFVANVDVCNEKMRIRFANGQTFLISIVEEN